MFRRACLFLLALATPLLTSTTGEALAAPSDGSGADRASAAAPTMYIQMVAGKRTSKYLIVRQRTATNPAVELDAHRWTISTGGGPKPEYIIFNKAFAKRTTLQRITKGGLLTVRCKGKKLQRSDDGDASRVVLPARCLKNPRAISVRATAYVNVGPEGAQVPERETYPDSGYYAQLRKGDSVVRFPMRVDRRSGEAPGAGH